MSTAVWPPISSEKLVKEEEACLVKSPANLRSLSLIIVQAKELEWLLSSLQETLHSLKAGLDEVSALLAPSEQPSTLVVSSHRSENLKGFVTRDGARVVKGDIKLRLPALPPPRGMHNYPVVISTEPQAPTIVLHQLTTARTLINACLDVVDVTSWAGNPNDANFIAGQLRLLDVNLQEAKAALKGGTALQLPWYKSPLDDVVCETRQDTLLLYSYQTLTHP
jgi:Rogdi leucine zipper containing protein